MVVAPVASGLAPRAAWRAGAWPAGRQHVAHEDFVDPLRRQFGPLQRGADHMGTELVGAKGDKSPIKRPSGVRAAERMTTGSEAAVIWGESPRGKRIGLRSSYDALQNMQRTIPSKARMAP